MNFEIWKIKKNSNQHTWHTWGLIKYTRWQCTFVHVYVGILLTLFCWMPVLIQSLSFCETPRSKSRGSYELADAGLGAKLYQLFCRCYEWIFPRNPQTLPESTFVCIWGTLYHVHFIVIIKEVIFVLFLHGCQCALRPQPERNLTPFLETQ